jgi:3-keto-5-aminohexanoate cleavage enzyme
MISVGLNGGSASATEHPRIPCTPDELARDAVEVWNAGATEVHIHVRRADGEPVHDLASFREAAERIRSETDLILNLTSSAAPGVDEQERLDRVSLRPDCVSFDTSEISDPDEIETGELDFPRRLALQCQRYGVKPELEIYDEGMIGNCLQLLDEGLLDAPLMFQFVLGVWGAAPERPETLLHLVNGVPEGHRWSVVSHGRRHLEMTTLAVILGGHLRTGLEDALEYQPGQPAVSNAQLVERIVRVCRELGREVATPDQGRDLLGLPRRT